MFFPTCFWHFATKLPQNRALRLDSCHFNALFFHEKRIPSCFGILKKHSNFLVFFVWIDYFAIACATVTATATVAPTIGLLPMPRKPIISTCAGTEEEPAITHRIPPIAEFACFRTCWRNRNCFSRISTFPPVYLPVNTFSILVLPHFAAEHRIHTLYNKYNK